MSKLEDSIIEHEAVMAKPYPDSEHLWTVGAGRCLEKNPLTPEEWKYLLDRKLITVSLSYEGSMWLLDRDLAASTAACERSFSFWPTLDEMRREVLIEMVYQMGIAKVREFVDMLAAIRNHDYKGAAAAGRDSLWAKQTPNRAHELMQRLEDGT